MIGWFLATPGQCLRAYDCFHDESNLTVIDLTSVEACREPEASNIHVKHEQVQIIQERMWEHYHVYHCNIVVNRLISHCGMHSHSSLVDGGFSNHIVDISHSKCKNLHETGKIEINGYSFVGNKINATNNHQTTTVGELDNKGTCKGRSFSIPGKSYRNVVVQLSVSIALRDYYTMFELSSSTFTFNDGTTCHKNGNPCIHPDFGMTFWDVSDVSDCSKTSRDVIYEGPADIAGMSESVQPGDFLSVRSGTSLFSLKLTDTSYVCHQNAFATDHARIYVLLKAHYGFYFTSSSIHPRNTDMIMYMNSKIAYTTSHTEKLIQEVYSELSKRDCEVERIALENKLAIVRHHPQAFGHIETGEQGYYSVVSGEVAHMMKCVAVDVSVRHSSTCYSYLPVTYNNKSMYMEPIARIITPEGNEMPCSKLTPPMYEVSSKWYAFNPSPTLAVTPKKLSPQHQREDLKYNHVKDLMNSGLYDQETMTKFKEFMSFPLIKMDSAGYVSAKLSNNGLYQHSPYDPSFFIDGNTIREQVSEYFSGIFAGIKVFGSSFGAVMGIIIIGKMIGKIMSIFINSMTMKKTFGWGWHMLAAILDSATHMVFALKPKKTEHRGDSMKDNPEDGTEEHLALQEKAEEDGQSDPTVAIEMETNPTCPLYPNVSLT